LYSIGAQKVAVAAHARSNLARLADQRASDHASKVMFVVFSVALAAYVHAKVAALAMMYPKAYAWWESGYANSAEQAEGSRPLITVPSMALRIQFPAFYWVKTLAMRDESVPIAGAEFLLLMASHYSRYLRAVHWDGSAAQLRFADLEVFLPTDQGQNWVFIWSAWNAKNAKGEYVNPWAGVLWASADAMQQSPAIRKYYANPPDRSMIRALFQGGLVEVAVLESTAAKSGIEMVHTLMGESPQATAVPCSGIQRANAAMTSASTVMMLGSMIAGARPGAIGKTLALVSGASGGAALLGAHRCSTNAYSLSASQ
jgi:hypothetical protein